MSSRKNVTLEPKLLTQCVGFMIGSFFFALGSTPGLSEIMGANTCNWLFFIGSWFFTAAGFIQLLLSGHMRNERGKLRAMWLAAATQFAGTILFNISTGSAIDAETVQQEMQLVWNPNAAGSALFLVSGGFALLVLVRSNTIWGPISKDWFSSWINMLGCIAFGVSAFGSLVLPDGAIKDAFLANWGTFIGAICFFVASAVILPEAIRTRKDEHQLEPFHVAQDIIDYPRDLIQKGEAKHYEHKAAKLEHKAHRLEDQADERAQRLAEERAKEAEERAQELAERRAKRSRHDALGTTPTKPTSKKDEKPKKKSEKKPTKKSQKD